MTGDLKQERRKITILPIISDVVVFFFKKGFRSSVPETSRQCP